MAKSKAKAKVAEVTEKKDVADVTEKKEAKDVNPATPDLDDKDQIDEEIKKVEEKMEILGKVKSPVFQKSSFIKTKAYNTPVCLYELPEDIRTYLTNMWWWTNVYEKGEKWLVKHWADMKMIEKLKKFISEHYL